MPGATRAAYYGDKPALQNAEIGAAVADLGAATAAAPSAMTQAAITGGESPTEAEFNTLRTDVVNLRATVAALVTDAAADRAKINALAGSLRTAGHIAT